MATPCRSSVRLVARLRGHTGRLQSLLFSGDGMLLSSSWAGDVRAWDTKLLDIAPHELLTRAEQATGLHLDGARLVPRGS